MKLIALVSMQSAAEFLQQHDPKRIELILFPVTAGLNVRLVVRADRWIDFSRGHSVVKIR
mgnify:CR=1 FL=1